VKQRITSLHIWIYHAIEGAVHNTAHHHPNWTIQEAQAARSIAKRAAGTLMADFPPSVLAALSALSGSGETTDHWPPRSRRRHNGTRREGSVVGYTRRSPRSLKQLHKAVGLITRDARRAGLTEREQALIEVLRMIGRALS